LFPWWEIYIVKVEFHPMRFWPDQLDPKSGACIVLLLFSSRLKNSGPVFVFYFFKPSSKFVALPLSGTGPRILGGFTTKENA
jgi:hypothetical protein